jgi:energy-converting hydrogenase Eha subunit C
VTAAVREYLRRLRSRQVVRPWALCAPVVVLLIALPMLRPLRAPGDASENELSRLAAIQSLVEHDSQAINDSDFFAALRHGDGGRDKSAAPALPSPWYSGDAVPGTIIVGNKYYSDKPPVMAFLLSWPYALMYRLGWDFQSNPALVAYVLTMLGVTLPVAGAAGLIYRMGRMFELKRPYRTGLALSVALGSGLISYATVLNPHAPAAALVLCACSCLFHVTVARNPSRGGAWLMISGLCAAFAAVIDLSAFVFLVLLAGVILAFRWNWTLRFGGVLLYLIGATPALLMHAALTLPVTGDLRPGFLHPELVGALAASNVANAPDDIDDGVRPAPWKVALFRSLDRTIGALVGSKGLLSHYPVVIIGVIGLGLVLRRHWPASTKVMAAVTLAGMIGIIAAYVILHVDWGQAMFGPRWFIVFLPLALFWAGAWLRKPHHVTTWAIAAVLLLFSMTVSILGAAAPFVRSAPGQYTVVAAIRKIANGDVDRPPGVQVVDSR